ncbi:MAG: c-type cytochrome [Rhodocyclaceae bacterium]|nr:c-type cytochrome [Rhodocyclaceae bacterium]
MNHWLTKALPCFCFLVSFHVLGADLQAGKEINATCAGCHGEFGQGGKKGEYPRIGGQRAAYLEQQLRNFRDRIRINIPMYPYTHPRELSEEDIVNVSGYLASLVLPTKPPEFKPTDDALTRLRAMEKVMIIPRAEGNVTRGEAHYQEHCANCHGKDGMGRSDFPMLVGQYTNYLMKQMQAYRAKERPHDEDKPGGILDRFSEQDLQDILAYLTSIQTKD